MRKCILLLALVLITTTPFSQQPAAAPTFDFDHYMKKRNRQNIAGWVLTSVGTAGLITTLAKDMNQSVGGIFVSAFSMGTVEPQYKSYTNYYVASGVALAAGIIYFSAARKNKRLAKGVQTSFKMEQAPLLYSNGIGSKDYPSLALSVPL